MREFNLVNVSSVEEVKNELLNNSGKVKIMSGGTDLLGGIKREIYEDYPETIINIGDLEELKYIKEEEGLLKIGSATKLEKVAESELIKEYYSALAIAAKKTASPHLRAMGSIGGNICQDIRCWFYRAADNYYHCKMKGGKKCFAPMSDNRYHSIFGGCNGCMGVNPSDTAPAIIALRGKVLTSKRTIEANDFFDMSLTGSTVLEDDEILLEIQIPRPKNGAKSTYKKFANRPTIEFPIVGCATLVEEGRVSICLNAVAPNPYKLTVVEEFLNGKTLTYENIEKASSLAVEKAKPLKDNKYKIQVAKTLIKRSITECKL
ncbi:MAG: FAD binding domain-containing protein [Firmicutes bacterium]|jgi:xanthine dehydrogenase YagS FAD-binding subunit|nr:FAD binding domain-containing protein [Bacillota bacterium]